MKVVCVVDNLVTIGLTFGKYYEVLVPSYMIPNGYLTIINDHEEAWSYKSDLFKKLEDIREDKLNKILECCLK